MNEETVKDIKLIRDYERDEMKSKTSDNNKTKYKEKVYNGRLGELYVEEELIKRGIFSMKTTIYSGFDLLTETNKRIEVKTSKYSKFKSKKNGKEYFYGAWGFVTNNTNEFCKKYNPCSRNYEYLVLVCLDKERKPVRFYIIPKEVIGKRKIVRIWESKSYRLGSKYDKYLNNWGEITNE